VYFAPKNTVSGCDREKVKKIYYAENNTKIYGTGKFPGKRFRGNLCPFLQKSY
jgi:hypothetical protein